MFHIPIWLKELTSLPQAFQRQNSLKSLTGLEKSFVSQHSQYVTTSSVEVQKVSPFLVYRGTRDFLSSFPRTNWMTLQITAFLKATEAI